MTIHSEIKRLNDHARVFLSSETIIADDLKRLCKKTNVQYNTLNKFLDKKYQLRQFKTVIVYESEKVHVNLYSYDSGFKELISSTYPFHVSTLCSFSSELKELISASLKPFNPSFKLTKPTLLFYTTAFNNICKILLGSKYTTASNCFANKFKRIKACFGITNLSYAPELTKMLAIPVKDFPHKFPPAFWLNERNSNLFTKTEDLVKNKLVSYLTYFINCAPNKVTKTFFELNTFVLNSIHNKMIASDSMHEKVGLADLFSQNVSDLKNTLIQLKSLPQYKIPHVTHNLLSIHNLLLLNNLSLSEKYICALNSTLTLNKKTNYELLSHYFDHKFTIHRETLVGEVIKLTKPPKTPVAYSALLSIYKKNINHAHLPSTIQTENFTLKLIKRPASKLFKTLHSFSYAAVPLYKVSSKFKKYDGAIVKFIFSNSEDRMFIPGLGNVPSTLYKHVLPTYIKQLSHLPQTVSQLRLCRARKETFIKIPKSILPTLLPSLQTNPSKLLNTKDYEQASYIKYVQKSKVPDEIKALKASVTSNDIVIKLSSVHYYGVVATALVEQGIPIPKTEISSFLLQPVFLKKERQPYTFLQVEV